MTTTQLTASALFVAQSVDAIFRSGVELLGALGLPVDTWRTGDPTLSLYKYLAEVLGSTEEAAAAYVRAGFLDDAEGDWLTIRAKEVFNVDRIEATAATSTIEITNSGGGLYEFAPGDLTVRNTPTNQTFRNTNSGTLSPGPGTTLSLDVVADVAGSEGSSAIDEIDQLVTTVLGAAITSSTRAVGVDEQSDESLREQCRATTGALSPNGPPDAYEYVCRNPDLTGVDDVTRARSTYDDTQGRVTVYIATPSGEAPQASVDACQAAVLQWSTPLTVTPTVESATPTTVDITATITGSSIPANAQTLIEEKIASYFAALDVGGLIAVSKLYDLIHEAVREISTITITIPSADVQLAAGEVAVLGTVAITEV